MVQTRGSQKRITIEESEQTIHEFWGDGMVVLYYAPKDTYELWRLKDDYAGFVIDIDGRGYEFIRQLKKEEVTQFDPRERIER